MEPIEAEIVDETNALTVSGANSLAAITKGEIDTQIATAKAYPRSLAVFKKRAQEMATYDEETAESCIYTRPVGEKFNPVTRRKEVEYANGLSIRMAEIVAACYGNIRVSANIIEQTERKVVARGVAFDMESNYASSSEVAESTVKKDGTPMSERMRLVIAKAALSKAWRDALFKVVPRALCKPIEAEARKLIAGDGDAASMSKRRGRVVTWLKSLQIDMERVWSALGIKGEDDLTSEHLEKLSGIKTAMKDGDVKVDDAFPAINAMRPEDQPVTMAALERQLKEAGSTLSAALAKAKEMFGDDVKRLENLTREQGEQLVDRLRDEAMKRMEGGNV